MEVKFGLNRIALLLYDYSFDVISGIDLNRMEERL